MQEFCDEKRASASCLFPQFCMCGCACVCACGGVFACVRTPAGGPLVDSSPLLRTISFCLWPQSIFRGLAPSLPGWLSSARQLLPQAKSDLACVASSIVPVAAPGNLSFRLSDQQLSLSWEQLEQQHMQGDLLAYRVQWSLGGEAQVGRWKGGNRALRARSSVFCSLFL